jgi:hypothetical protein
MISSVSASPPLVTRPTIPRLRQLWMFDEPMLRVSPSSIASIINIAPGKSASMNASDVSVLYQRPITLSSIFGSRLLVGT